MTAYTGVPGAPARVGDTTPVCISEVHRIEPRAAVVVGTYAPGRRMREDNVYLCAPCARLLERFGLFEPVRLVG